MKKIPTYLLDEDFSNKLDIFTDEFISKGYKTFEKEFAQINSFLEDANNDTSDRTDHQLRRSEKERYLLELVSYKIYDKLNKEEFNKQVQRITDLLKAAESIDTSDLLTNVTDHQNKLLNAFHSEEYGFGY